MHPHLRRLAPGLLVLLGTALLIATVAATVSGSDPAVAEGGQESADVSVLEEPADSYLSPASPDATPESEDALALNLAGQGVSEPVPVHIVDQPSGEEITVAEVGANACVGVKTLSSCGGEAAIAEGHLLAIELCSPGLPAGSYRVLGMVPDGVEAVRIESEGLGSTTATVSDNAYEAIAQGVPGLIVWETASGEELSVPAPVSPEYEPSECEA